VDGYAVEWKLGRLGGPSVSSIRIIPPTDEAAFPHQQARSFLERLPEVLRSDTDIPAIVAAGAKIGWPQAVIDQHWEWMRRGKCFDFNVVAYKFDRATTAAALRRLLSSDGVTVVNEPTTLRALAAFEAGQADFSDYVILETARRAGALPVHTFDDHLARAEGAELVPRA
jgi:hypothetical protein